jgi:phosphinothricin acetyltransferase
MIRPVEASDASAIAGIYNHYIDHTIITFELDPIDAAEIESRIERVTSAGFPWIVFVDPDSNQLVGYAYAGPWRTRTAYRFVVESAIYLRNGSEGQGIGKQLYAELFEQLRMKEYRSVIAGISLPNEASVAAHRSMGFRKAGFFEKVGYKFDRWIDVEFWQLDL